MKISRNFARLMAAFTMLICSQVMLLAQSTAIQGTVEDASGEPLIGATVTVEGTKTAAMTDFDGKYSIKADKGNVLVFTYVGYTPVKVTVTGSEPINVTMKEDATILNEVVVTALGIKKEAKSLSYTVQQVKSDEINKIADPNFVNNLAGKVAGVTINSSSAGVGGGTRIVMRGTKSINGNNNALYVVDGIPMMDTGNGSAVEGAYEGAGLTGDPLAAINSDDIESISVLSGPSAAALYGAAAANGVVMVTTKKGKSGTTQVTLSNNTTFSRAMSTPKFQHIYGQTETGSVYSWGAKLANASSYDPSDFFQTGYNVTNNASLTTGTDRNQTYLSIGTVNARGIIHNNDFERYSANVRNTTKMANDKLTMDLAFSMSQIYEHNMTAQGLYRNPLTGLYLFPVGDDFRKAQAYERWDAERGLMTQFWPYNYAFATENPYWVTEHESMPNKKNRYTASAQFRYEFADWINVSARAKYDRANDTYEKKYDAGTNQLYASKYGRYEYRNATYRQIFGELLVSINKYFADRTWDLTLNAGGNFDNLQYRSAYFGGHLNSVANLFTFANVRTTDMAQPNQDGYDINRRALFASAQVGYRSMAYLDVTARNDWSSTFKGTSTSSVFYPSIGLSGILTEIFNIKTDIMPFAKARVSYSEVGNSPEVFITRPTYELRSGVPVTQTRRPNSDLKPERTKSWELGLNFVFFRDRLSLDATLYKSSTYNQFFERTLAASTGYTSEIVNGGRVDNKGIELSMRYNDKFGELTWSSYVTYSLNRNKVHTLLNNYEDPYTGELVSLKEIDMGGTGLYKMMVTEGGSLGDIYVNTLRTDEHGAIYVDPVTQTVVGQPNVWVKAGNAAPKYNLGWGNNFSWRGFHLGFLASARVGGIVVSQTQAYLDRYGVSAASAAARENGGVVINGYLVPAEEFYKVVGAENNNGIGSWYVYSATNVRLAELTFGYDVPINKWVSWIKGLNVSFIGKNLFFFYKKAPYDPEATASTGTYMQGIDNFMTPSTRNLGFSVKVNF